MTTGTIVPAVLPRPRVRVLWQAALVLWLPALVPLVLGLLRDCGHCGTTYLRILPLVPGVIVPVLAGLDGAWFLLAAVPPTLAQWLVLYLVGREAGTLLRCLVGSVVAVGVAAQAIGLAMAIRA